MTTQIETISPSKAEALIDFLAETWRRTADHLARGHAEYQAAPAPLGLLVHQAADVRELDGAETGLFDDLWPAALEQAREALAQLEQEGPVEHEGLP